MAEIWHHGLAFERQFGGVWTAWGAIGLWLLAVSALVLSVPYNLWLQGVLGARGAQQVRRLGVATYPLYLLHDKLGQVGIGGLHRHVGYGWGFLLSISAVSACAVWIALSAEPWLRSTMTKLFGAVSR